MPQLDIPLTPQNDARRAVIMSMPMQIERELRGLDCSGMNCRNVYHDQVSYSDRPREDFWFLKAP